MKSTMAAAVKRVTAPRHRRAEEAVRAFEPFASRARYAAYLARLHGFYAALEPQLAWPERSKLPALDADLEALGATGLVSSARARASGSHPDASGSLRNAGLSASTRSAASTGRAICRSAASMSSRTSGVSTKKPNSTGAPCECP